MIYIEKLTDYRFKSNLEDGVSSADTGERKRQFIVRRLMSNGIKFTDKYSWFTDCQYALEIQFSDGTKMLFKCRGDSVKDKINDDGMTLTQFIQEFIDCKQEYIPGILPSDERSIDELVF
jgi:hypothetical protein